MWSKRSPLSLSGAGTNNEAVEEDRAHNHRIDDERAQNGRGVIH